MERLRVDLLEQVGINIDIEWDSLGSRLGLSEGEVRELAGMTITMQTTDAPTATDEPLFQTT